MSREFPGRYTIRKFSGVAFYIKGYAQIWEPYTYLAHYNDCETPERDPEECCKVEMESDDGEWTDDTSTLLAVMVGDDHEYRVSPDDITPIEEGDYCHECGQIGCTADGYDRG